MNGVVVETQGVTKVFDTGGTQVHALRGIDLQIKAGEFTAVAGPSGSGKTTLFNLIGALDEPTSGQIHVAGVALKDLDRRQRARLRLDKIGFVFQAYNLIPVLSAFENIEYPLILRKVHAAERRHKVRDLLEAVGLADLADRRPMLMSGGQQQRVAIARALVCDPSIILADEPTANLDSETGSALLDLMANLNRDKGLTFLFSTHDPMVMTAARRLIRLKDGSVASDEVRGDGQDPASAPAG
jgi:putative ABC transport system ATP-binding protein